ncbi:cytochrome P450 2J4-like [Amphiura filiformis]|uniref:cytochrome P450 2J4-like n=1 Tax=Amphiura filiformis TaxID=82378 RepID=UPI003B2101FA
MSAALFIAWLDTRTILVFFVTSLVILWFMRRPKNLPPGLVSLPLVGSIPGLVIEYYRLGKPKPHDLLRYLAEKHGKLYSLRLGPMLVVVANDYYSIKEVGQHHCTANRPNQINDLLDGDGIALCSGEPWLQQRRFTLTTMRSFGVGKMSFEEQISEETDHLLKEFQKHNGKPFDPKFPILNSTANVLCSVMFGKRYEYTDDEFHSLLDIIDRLTKSVGSGGAKMYVPILRNLIGNKDEDLFTDFVRFLRKVVLDHQNLYDSQNLHDYIDVYLREMELSRDATSRLSEPNLVASLVHLFFAGTDTSANTIRWALLYMIQYPQIQKKVQEEIDSVVGRNRHPKLTDRPHLLYTDAVIHEVSRMCTVLPLSVPHSASQDFTIRGYNIPKDTVLVYNLWAAHNDPDMWKDPETFHPERFLDGKGGLHKTEFVIPFSLGRRQCIGEQLARKEVFIFFTHLMHRFTFKKPNDKPLNFKGELGITYSPVTFDICAIVRDL